MISMISAYALNSEGRPVIGRDNRIPWRLPEDMQWFKAHTMHKLLLMGRKTYQSIHGGTLKNRRICVLTRDPNFTVSVPSDRAYVQRNIENLLLAHARTDLPLVVCGGSSIYEQFLPFASSVLLTEVHQTHEGDAFLPFTHEDLAKKHGFTLVMLDRNQRQFRDEAPEVEWTYRLYTRPVRADVARS